MTREEALAALRKFSIEGDSDAAVAACIVLDEVVPEIVRLRQIVRDLVDFDMGEEPMLDALCAAEGPRQLARMGKAWEAAIAEVGQRDQARFYGDKP